MEIQHLKYFYYVAREGGFSSASRYLRIAQPAITKMVKTLEEEIGSELFDRSLRQVRLTKSGADLFRHCEVIFGEFDKVCNKAKKSDQKIRGTINIGATEAIAAVLCPRVIGKLVQTEGELFPQVVASTASHIVDLIIKEKIDFGLALHHAELPETVEVRQTFAIRHYLVVAKSKFKDRHTCESFIGSREVDDVSVTSYPTLNKLQKIYPQARIRYSTNSLSAHREMVLAGYGVSILPDFLVESDIKSGKLKCLLADQNFDFRLKLLSKRSRSFSAAADRFTQIFEKFLQK